MAVLQTIFVKAAKSTKPDCVKNGIGCIMLKGWAGPLDGTEAGALEVSAKIMGNVTGFKQGDVVAVEQYRNGQITGSYLFDDPMLVLAKK
ncbi:hypothetical protein CLV58_109198 [Spirosoma oryzae]|uniref:Uncharacterized protein n=1 Tax=Spirosoma oryzae TaxID=1469603 RepID=A0A2T0SYG1_9BACT|nr:hypothetical protein [Spirosoma oryzae]PRY38471.1 hypothetical protein CLV58_109198 [Spirosoma oryzae]